MSRFDYAVRVMMLFLAGGVTAAWAGLLLGIAMRGNWTTALLMLPMVMLGGWATWHLLVDR